MAYTPLLEPPEELARAGWRRGASRLPVAETTGT
jgi:hypothetical protein